MGLSGPGEALLSDCRESGAVELPTSAFRAAGSRALLHEGLKMRVLRKREDERMGSTLGTPSSACRGQTCMVLILSLTE